MGRRWRVEAWHPSSGAVITPRYDKREQTFKYAVLRDGDITPLNANTENLSCVVWSADGRFLSYMTGESQIYRRGLGAKQSSQSGQGTSKRPNSAIAQR